MRVMTPRRQRDHRIPYATALKIERLYARAQHLIDEALADYAKRRVNPADGLPRTMTGRPDMRTREWKAKQDARRAALAAESDEIKVLRRLRAEAPDLAEHKRLTALIAQARAEG